MAQDQHAFAAATLLGGMLAGIPEAVGVTVEAGEIAERDGAMVATIVVPGGDRFEASVRWLNGGEAS